MTIIPLRPTSRPHGLDYTRPRRDRPVPTQLHEVFGIANHQREPASLPGRQPVSEPAADPPRVVRVRSRDPQRGERILRAATELFVERGYHAVSIGDIGGAAGIVGTGIYRHFENKAAILVELCERVVDHLLTDAERSLREVGDPLGVLTALVDRQVDFTLQERSLYLAYVLEARNLPAEDERRLRWKQRHYVELWNDMLTAACPEIGRDEAKVRVGAAISAIHSPLRFRSTELDDQRLHAILVASAQRTLGIDALVDQARDVDLRERAAEA